MMSDVSLKEKNGFRFLLADDNPISLKPVASILKSLNQSVHIVNNGQEAFDAVVGEDFDIVLMDCNMPVMDGFEAAKKIREWEKSSGASRIPIIAITSLTLSTATEDCKAAGMDAHIPKPVTVSALRAIINQLSSLKAS